MNKSQLAAHAKKVCTDCQTWYRSEIQESIKNTTAYSQDAKFEETGTVSEQVVELINDDSVSAVFHYAIPTQRTALLNFASYKNPGGRFLDGSSAQEEAICHNSILYPVLSSFEATYYAWNRNNLNKGLYRDRALYSKDIIFFRDKDIVKCDVITCAAPNNSVGLKYQSFTHEDNSNALKSRIHFLLDIAHEQQVDVLILGAYGCGVFKQSPTEVATTFKEYLNEHKYFKKVVFAIPAGKSRENYNTFKAILAKK